MNLDEQIFLAINKQVGRRKWLDMLALFGAKWLVYAMGAWLCLWVFFSNTVADSLNILFYAAGALATSWVVGLIIGKVVGRPRPQVALPETKLLFKPLYNWKSFPSDHTMAASTLFLIALLVGLPGAWVFLPLTLMVGLSRVYCGVHYLSDVAGGMVTAGVGCFLFAFILGLYQKDTRFS